MMTKFAVTGVSLLVLSLSVAAQIRPTMAPTSIGPIAPVVKPAPPAPPPPAAPVASVTVSRNAPVTLNPQPEPPGVVRKQMLGAPSDMGDAQLRPVRSTGANAIGPKPDDPLAIGPKPDDPLGTGKSKSKPSDSGKN